jgi:transposase
MLGMVFGLRLRQSEGLLSSVLDLMELDLPVPDHTTLSRLARTWMPSVERGAAPNAPLHVLVDSTGLKIYGAGQWLEEKHGAKSRRGWRKLHLALDADSGEIIAHSLTDREAGDASQLEPLLDQIDNEIGQFTADGAYDGCPTYDAVLRHSAGAKVVIPPRSNAVERPPIVQASCQRDDHIASMQKDGRLKWQASNGYGKRALIETAMSRYKGIIGPRLRARSFRAQQTEATIGVAILNRMLACARPKSVRCKAPTAATK